MSLEDRRRAAVAKAERHLFRNFGPAPERLRATADATTDDDLDLYGSRGAVAEVEAEVAELLGKPACAFMPTGVVAQQSVLRALADERGSTRVAVHGLSHFLRHELNALEEVHGLRVERLTDEPRQPRPDDLDAIPGRLAAVCLELPLREAGYVLPAWDELVVFSAHCAERGVPLHLDGARLWESTAYLGHTVAEVAELAGTVYVSFYKGLGGLAGAAVAGPEVLIAAARRWQRRLGGNPPTLVPYAVSARSGLRTLLPRMAEFHQRAVELAAGLVAAGFRVVPDPPHANAFKVYAERDAVEMSTAVIEHAEQTGDVLSPPWKPADVPGWSWTELTVNAVTMEWTADAAVQDLRGLLRQ